MIVCSCNQSETTEDPDAHTTHTNSENDGSMSSIGLYAGCYQMAKGRDSGFLRIEISDSTVTGTLVYAWWEKDRNEGTVSGVLRDSLLLLDYRFQSEGTTSVREEIFRVSNKTLLPAYGAVTEKNGKMVFQDVHELSFNENFPFTKTDCKN